MDKAYELKYHQLEEQHWWFVSRRDMVFRLIQNIDKDAHVLEIGCSGGPLLTAMREVGFKHLTGIDISESAIELSKQRKIPNTHIMDGAATSFPDNSFDVVIASDVLEHIETEEVALNEWMRILKPGGKVYIFVPAFNFLWTKHDDINHHFRRYTKGSLVKAIEQSGFVIDRSSYWNFGLFFPTVIVRSIQRLIPEKSDIQQDTLIELNPYVNGFLSGYVKFENAVLEKMNLPVGVSTFAIAHKPK